MTTVMCVEVSEDSVLTNQWTELNVAPPSMHHTVVNTSITCTKRQFIFMSSPVNIFPLGV